jgi:hypothetical protein
VTASTSVSTYLEGSRDELRRVVLNTRDILEGEHYNNKMERMNGELRDRERVIRTLEKADTPILSGMQIFHNYIRPHMALDGKTPADKAGITIKGDNKWITLIQNASRKTAKS